MHLEYLADHPEFVPILADWLYAEWKTLMPDWSHAEALADLRSHVNHCAIPTTIVAMEGKRLLGSASLIVEDLPGWEHLSPWIASVFVAPEHRGKGIGKALVQRLLSDANSLGTSPVYLFTADKSAYYQRMGWETFAEASHAGHRVRVMRHA